MQQVLDSVAHGEQGDLGNSETRETYRRRLRSHEDRLSPADLLDQTVRDLPPRIKISEFYLDRLLAQ